jgi:preprotein translocase subunit SecY
VNHRLVNNLLVLLLVSPLLLLWATAQSLPEPLASHFNAAGQVEGHASRAEFVWVMSLVLTLPLLLGTALPALVQRLPTSLIDLPNKEHWLSPEREPATRAFLCSWFKLFALALAAFQASVYALTLQAQALHPPALNPAGMHAALLGFGIVSAGLTIWLLLHFGRRR